MPGSARSWGCTALEESEELAVVMLDLDELHERERSQRAVDLYSS